MNGLKIDTNKGESTATTTLLEKVKAQMEFYFSNENLQTDVFLMSQMDANKSVPIAVVMKVCMYVCLYVCILRTYAYVFYKVWNYF